MGHFRVFVLALALAGTQVYAGESTDREIRRVLDAQVEAWNRGDVGGFMIGYAEDCMFVGKTILHGRAQLQARYQREYPSQDAMGKLEFADLAVTQLDDRVATVTGQWHLNRSESAGGPAGGVFSLVFQKISQRWQIVLDHTS